MFSDSVARTNAIRFRRLYLETISAGEIDNATAWRLSKYVNIALWSSRETVGAMTILLGMFLVAMPLGSEELLLFQRLRYFAAVTVCMFTGLFLILFPLHFSRIKGWLSSKFTVALAASIGTLYAAACFWVWREVFGVDLGFTYGEMILRLAPIIVATFGVGFAISPYTSQRLMQRRNRASLTNLIDQKKRGQLISVSAQDHYVAITTTAGTDLIRMALSAAIDLVEPGIGLQIHRSHWAAISAIKGVDEQNKTVELINGESLPFSPQHLPTLTLELSRKDVFSQQERLFARDVSEVDILAKTLKVNKEARATLDKMFLEVFQGKPVSEAQRLKIAYQIYRLSMTASVFLVVQVALFAGLASMGTYGLYELPWYQPPLYWLLGYALCAFATIPSHVLVWYFDLRFGSNGWLGIMMHTVMEGTLTVTLLYWLSYTLFGPVMVSYLTFLICTYILHSFHAPLLHLSVREYQSFSSWKKTLNIAPILLQLPLNARGEIVAISADSRTVSVTTTSGKSTVKKKFKDALEMLGERKGIQVHRSHWVANAYIKGRRVEGTANYVELTTGELVPLAAANIKKVDKHLYQTG